MLTTVLFDLDGTLSNSLPLIKRTYAKVFAEMGLAWGKDDVMRLIGLPLVEIGREFAGSERTEEFFQRYQRHYRQEHDRCMELFPGTLEMLKTAGKHFTLGIVTSKSRVGTNMTLELLALKEKFSVIITADDVTQHKPHPQPVTTALKQLGKTSAETAFVGDSPFDIKSGSAAGVTTVGVSWGMANTEELRKHRPDHLVHTCEELTQLLVRLSV